MSDDLRERFQVQAKSIAIPQQTWRGSSASGARTVRRRIVSVTTVVAVSELRPPFSRSRRRTKAPPVASETRPHCRRSCSLRTEAKLPSILTRDLTYGLGYIGHFMLAMEHSNGSTPPPTRWTASSICREPPGAVTTGMWKRPSAHMVAGPHGQEVMSSTRFRRREGSIRDVGRPLNLFATSKPDAIWVHSGSSADDDEALYRVDPMTLE